MHRDAFKEMSVINLLLVCCCYLLLVCIKLLVCYFSSILFYVIHPMDPLSVFSQSPLQQSCGFVDPSSGSDSLILVKDRLDRWSLSRCGRPPIKRCGQPDHCLRSHSGSGSSGHRSGVGDPLVTGGRVSVGSWPHSGVVACAVGPARTPCRQSYYDGDFLIPGLIQKVLPSQGASSADISALKLEQYRPAEVLRSSFSPSHQLVALLSTPPSAEQSVQGLPALWGKEIGCCAAVRSSLPMDDGPEQSHVQADAAAALPRPGGGGWWQPDSISGTYSGFQGAASPHPRHVLRRAPARPGLWKNIFYGSCNSQFGSMIINFIIGLTRAPLGGLFRAPPPPLVFLRYLLNGCRYHRQTCSSLSPPFLHIVLKF